MSDHIGFETRRVELTLEEIIDFVSIDSSIFDLFLDFVSEKHSGTPLLQDIDYQQISPLVIDVTGDISELVDDPDYIPPYGEETIWDMRRDEPEAFERK